jgi:hypothetical protein
LEQRSARTVGCKNLREQVAELHFAPGSARLDVREDFFQITDAGGQRPHLAQPAVHLLEPVAHEFERFAETLFEGCVQLSRPPSRGFARALLSLSLCTCASFVSTVDAHGFELRFVRVVKSESCCLSAPRESCNCRRAIR